MRSDLIAKWAAKWYVKERRELERNSGVQWSIDFNPQANQRRAEGTLANHEGYKTESEKVKLLGRFWLVLTTNRLDQPDRRATDRTHGGEMSGFIELTKDEIKAATELVVSIPIAIIIMINSLSELRDGDQELRLIPFGRNGNGFTYYIRDGKVKEQRKPVVADVYQLELPEVYRSMQEGVGLYIAVLRIAADAARPHRTDSGGN